MLGLLALELKFISLELETVLLLLSKSGISCMVTLNVVTLFSIFIDPIHSLLKTKEIPETNPVQKELQLTVQF